MCSSRAIFAAQNEQPPPAESTIADIAATLRASFEAEQAAKTAAEKAAAKRAKAKEYRVRRR
jgi:cell pole-organizing protein PopZ